MRVDISDKLFANFTDKAKIEMKSQINKFVDNVIDEAEHIEMSHCKKREHIQITPRTIEKAVEFVIEYRTEKSDVHWLVAYGCPIIYTAAGFGMSYGFTSSNLRWVAIVSLCVFMFIVAIQIAYFWFKKK